MIIRGVNGVSQVAQAVKNPPASAGDAGNRGSIPASGRSPGKGNGSPLQYSCLENPMDRGAWWATVHGVTKSWTQLRDTAQHTVKLIICYCLLNPCTWTMCVVCFRCDAKCQKKTLCIKVCVNSSQFQNWGRINGMCVLGSKGRNHSRPPPTPPHPQISLWYLLITELTAMR